MNTHEKLHGAKDELIAQINSLSAWNGTDEASLSFDAMITNVKTIITELVEIVENSIEVYFSEKETE